MKKYSVEKIAADGMAILCDENGEQITAKADCFDCRPQKGMVFSLGGDEKYSRDERAEQELKKNAAELLKNLVGGSSGSLKKR